MAKYYIPTNTENLKSFIATGLVYPKDNLYADIITKLNGNIALFSKNMLEYNVLALGKSESNTLSLCILEIDEADIKAGLIKDEIGYICQGPLPLYCIKNVLFENQAKIEEFKSELKVYNNVTLPDFALKSDPKVFKPSNTLPFSKDYDTLANKITNPVDLDLANSLGGLLLALFDASKYDENANALYQSFCASKDKLESKEQNERLKILFGLFNSNYKLALNSEVNKIFYEICRLCIYQAKNYKGAICAYLDTIKSAANISKILKELEYGISNESPKELFKNNDKFLSKMLIALFLSQDLGDFYERFASYFDESQVLEVVLIIAMRLGFNKLDANLKNYKGLNSFVSLMMAKCAHEHMKSQVIFKNAISPLTLMQMLQNSSFATHFASEFNIDNELEISMQKTASDAMFSFDVSAKILKIKTAANVAVRINPHDLRSLNINAQSFNKLSEVYNKKCK